MKDYGNVSFDEYRRLTGDPIINAEGVTPGSPEWEDLRDRLERHAYDLKKSEGTLDAFIKERIRMKRLCRWEYYRRVAKEIIQGKWLKNR